MEPRKQLKPTNGGRANQGFASMDDARRKEIARRGGEASAESRRKKALKKPSKVTQPKTQ